MRNRSPRPRTWMAGVLCLLGLWLGMARASGDEEFLESRFNPEHHVPAPALPAYAAGEPGVVMPSYWRVYLFLAWRALNRHPLSGDELALLRVQQWRVGTAPVDADYPFANDRNGVASWLKARRLVADAPEVMVDIEADVGDFSVILNCPRDAFERAATTLQQRLAQGGQKWAAVWLANQDAVFDNCSPPRPPMGQPGTLFGKRRVLPAALPDGAPDWLVRDHAYQSAAALFYAGFYDLARKDFLAMAKDAASPWQPLGQYLAARCLLRKASVIPAGRLRPGDPDSPDKVLLRSAHEELRQIAGDYPPARQLLGWVEVRLHPEGRRLALSRLLSTAKIDAGTPALLTDYLFLLDRMKPADMIRATDPMSAWIGVMQASAQDEASRREALALARARWEEAHDAPWLLAVLTNARAGELQPGEIRAAAALAASEAAWGPIQYQRARLLLDAGDSEDADALISVMLRLPQPPHVRNRWLRMKMASAHSAEAFFAAAARTPAETPAAVPVPDEGRPATTGFDEDVSMHLRRHFALAQLENLRTAIPAPLQKWVGEFMWTRAVMLGEYALAQRLTPELMQGRATTKPLYERFLKAKTNEDKRDAALLILANSPELAPAIDSPAGTEAAGAMTWTCARHKPPADGSGAIAPAFLTSQQRADAEREQRQLRAQPLRSAYLIPPLMAWAKKNSRDPEAPKALHFLVMATRNECTAGVAPGTPKAAYSKQAFQLLHGLFPRSAWTLKTPYYY